MRPGRRHPGAVPERSREAWERARAGGRTRFLLVRGVLARGLPLGVLMTVVIAGLEGTPLADAAVTPRYWVVAVFCFLVFSATGSLAAWSRWQAMERRYGPGPRT